MQEFYSNGKLLLSGEYAVLDGAIAWAAPTKFGQHLKVSTNDSDRLSWNSMDEKGSFWFNAVYTKDLLTEISSSDKDTSKTLLKILREAQKLNSDFLSDSTGFEIETKLSFPRDWGLGSSSTLLNNIAQWAQVDAYELLGNAFSGSGYDIACAQNNSPIIYQLEKGKPVVKSIDTKPAFSNSLYFVYLNKKRNSREAISTYRQLKIDKVILIEKISALTLQMVRCSHVEAFEQLVTAHESILSEALGIPTVKEELFSDYNRSIKSLGAWGGDFILAAGGSDTADYFSVKGYTTVIPFKKMIL
jgi:mevalonate kinase